MPGPPNKRRRTKAIGPDSDVFTKATTHKTITTTNRSGMVVTKDILVPLVPLVPNSTPLENSTASSSQSAWTDNLPQDFDGGFSNMIEDDFNIPNKTKVCLMIFIH